VNVVAPALTGNPYGDHESREGLLVAHTLRAEGFDASEDGTGRGVPLVCGALGAKGGPHEGQGQAAYSGHIIAAQCHGSNVGPMETTPAVGFAVNQRREGRLQEVAGAVHEPSGTQVDGVLCLQGAGRTSQRSEGSTIKDDGTSFTLNCTDTHGVAGAAVIPRRLTPVECSRLQGFPDDWNAWGVAEDGEGYVCCACGEGFTDPYATGVRTLAPAECPKCGEEDRIVRGSRVELSDSARYRQMGNAVSVPVAEWIGHRLLEAAGREAAR
jgi:hypothetical protein